jgi:uncharacterized protein (TIGR02118 family)
MIKVSVFYPAQAGATFDMDYYVNRHMAICRDTLGAALKGVQVDRGLGGAEPGSPAPYLAIGHLLFDSVEAFGAAFAPAAAAIQGDIPNYTNVQPVVQVSEIKM